MRCEKLHGHTFIHSTFVCLCMCVCDNATNAWEENLSIERDMSMPISKQQPLHFLFDPIWLRRRYFVAVVIMQIERSADCISSEFCTDSSNFMDFGESAASLTLDSFANCHFANVSVSTAIGNVFGESFIDMVEYEWWWWLMRFVSVTGRIRYDGDNDHPDAKLNEAKNCRVNLETAKHTNIHQFIFLLFWVRCHPLLAQTCDTIVAQIRCANGFGARVCAHVIWDQYSNCF